MYRFYSIKFWTLKFKIVFAGRMETVLILTCARGLCYFKGFTENCLGWLQCFMRGNSCYLERRLLTKSSLGIMNNRIWGFIIVLCWTRKVLWRTIWYGIIHGTIATQWCHHTPCMVVYATISPVKYFHLTYMYGKSRNPFLIKVFP
jgi:hypothetical protein